MTPETLEIFVVSDGTAETAHAVTRAIMYQFSLPWHLRTFSGIRHSSEIRRVVEEASSVDAYIAFTLVEGEVKDELLSCCDDNDVPHIDLLGPLLKEFSSKLGAKPRMEPGLLHTIRGDYFQRIEAVEFTVRHDDGANPKTLHRADIMLVGVSRTSKTPLSMYLAQRGYRTGNVPIVPGLAPPEELFEISPDLVFGLTISPSLLLTIREARLRNLGSSVQSAYVDSDRIKEELEAARRLFRRQRWTMIDISGKAVEENAARIIELLETRVASRAKEKGE